MNNLIKDYYVILSHSDASEITSVKAVPKNLELVMTTSCSRTFSENHTYRKILENSRYINSFINTYNFLMNNNNNNNNSDVPKMYKKLLRNVHIHRWSQHRPSMLYPDTIMQFGPPTIFKNGSSLLFGVYKLPMNIQNITQRTLNESLVNITKKTKVPLSKVLNLIHNNTSSGHKAVVFGLFCRTLPGYNKEQNRLSPTKVSRTYADGLINKSERKFYKVKRFRSLRPLISRRPFQRTINVANKIKRFHKSLTIKPKIFKDRTKRTTVKKFWASARK